MLPEYFTRHLSDDEMKFVRAHLKDCQSCRERLGLMEFLNEHNPSSSGADAKYHLTDELLSEYYEHRDFFDEKELKRIEQHLEDCPECAASLAFLTNLEVKLQQASARADSEISPSRGFWGTFLTFVRRPALAYLIVLILAYPAARWIMSPTTGPVDNSPVSPGVFVIGEQTRSSEDIKQVLRETVDDIVHIKIPFYHLSHDNDYNISIKPVNSDDLPGPGFILDFSEPGAINILLSTRELYDGAYVLYLTESSRDESETGTVGRYIFELITR